MKTKVIGILVIVLGIAFGCNDLFNDDSSIEGKGTVVVNLTDAPFPHDLVEEVNVTIDWIKFKISEDEVADESGDDGTGEGTGEESGEEETEDDGSDFIMLEVGEPGVGLTFNLLELQNGESDVLGELDIPAGNYSEIRMHVIEAKIKLVDEEEEMDIKIPSGGSSGLKIKIDPSLVVSEGQNYQLLLDFDVSRSFKVKGNINSNGKGNGKAVTGFIFKPVIRAINLADAGSVSGIVTEAGEEGAEAIYIKNAHLYLIDLAGAEPDTVATAKTTEEGFYRMVGIPVGDYTLSCEKETYESGSSDVTIEEGVEKDVPFVLVKETETVPAE